MERLFGKSAGSLLLILCLHSVAAADTIRVGVYDNRSLIFHDTQGEVTGFFPEVLSAIAGQAGWKLDYQACLWAQCLDRLKTGELDLLPAIARTEERAQQLLFSTEPMLLNWGVLYTREGEGVEQIFALAGQRVGLLRGDIYNQGFREQAQAFGVSMVFVEYDTFAAVLDALQAGQVRAGVVNRIYEALDSQVQALHRTPVIFSPVELFFAASRQWPDATRILQAIDTEVRALKRNPRSVYHDAVHRWYGDLERFTWPAWVRWVVLAIAVGLGLLLVGTAWLRREVARRTRQLRVSEQRYRQLYEDNPTMLFKLDADRNIASINRYGAGMLDYAPEDMIGQPAVDMLTAQSRMEVASFIASHPDPQAEEIRRFEVRVRRRDGTDFPMRLTGCWLEDPEQGLQLTMVGEDVSEQARLTEELAFQIAFDPLTGLPNRREYLARVDRAVAQDDANQHALLHIDIDHFRLINDEYGHAVGDRVLNDVARILRASVKRADLVARLGDDEFGLLVLNCDQACAQGVAERLLTGLREQQRVRPVSGFRVRASIGVAAWSAERPSARVLSEAEAAVAVAKQEGGDRWRQYHVSDQQIAAHSGEAIWVHRVDSAIEEGRLELFAQPMLSLRGTEPLGRYELLLRLREPDGQIVLPGQFLGALERYRHISAVDRWVVNAAFAWLSGQPAERFELISINLSGQSLSDANFADYLVDQVGLYQPPAERICFEITETAAIHNMASAQALMDRLRRLGFQFALDDFGAGVSSFAYLRSLPVNYLKLDGQFVREAVHNPVDRALIAAIQSVAAILGMKTVAEYAENSDTVVLLRELGIDYAQGFAIGVPRPLDDL